MTSSVSLPKPTAYQEVRAANHRTQKIGGCCLELTHNLIYTAVVDSELARNIVCGRRIFTNAAKEIVRDLLERSPALSKSTGIECGKPALMLPSVDPGEYSFVSRSHHKPPRVTSFIWLVVHSLPRSQRRHFVVCRLSGGSMRPG